MCMSSGRNLQNWGFSTRQPSARIQALPHTLRPWEISSSLWSLHRTWTSSLASGLQSHAHSFYVILMLLFSHQVVSDSHDPTDCSMPDFPVFHHLLEFAQVHVHWWCQPTISFSIALFSFCLQSSPASGAFPMSQLFASGGPSIGGSASASVLPKSTQVDFL